METLKNPKEIVYANLKKSEAFEDILGRQCRPNAYPDNDNHFEEDVEKKNRRMRREQNILGITYNTRRRLGI